MLGRFFLNRALKNYNFARSSPILSKKPSADIDTSPTNSNLSVTFKMKVLQYSIPTLVTLILCALANSSPGLFETPFTFLVDQNY
jgi:hypothetical protein